MLLKAANLLGLVLVSQVDATYEHVEGWPRGMPSESYALSAVGIDPYALGGAEVYVAQRGANLTQPILVFNETGDLVRSFGADSIARDTTGTWGCHGLSVKSTPSMETQIWVNDFVEFTTKVYSSKGKLLSEFGTKSDPGPDVAPLQFDKVADTAFGSGESNMVYVSDGDGSSNHRVIALEAGDVETLSQLSSEASPSKARGHLRRSDSQDSNKILWIGGNNNTEGAFSDVVLGLSLTSMHSVAHHARTNTLFAADRENNRTLHVDATNGNVKGVWEMADILEDPHQGGFETVYGVRTFYSEKYNKDLVFFALGDMDASDSPPKQGVVVLDGSGISADGPGAVKPALQRISVDSSQCWTPHLMGVNELNGNLYIACVGANSAIWKYQYHAEE